jgi:hypothetical protein
MNFKNKKIWISILVVVGVIVIYRYVNRDGNSYDECMDKRRNEIQNNVQARIASQYCKSLFKNNVSRNSNEISLPNNFYPSPMEDARQELARRQRENDVMHQNVRDMNAQLIHDSEMSHLNLQLEMQRQDLQQIQQKLND